MVFIKKVDLYKYLLEEASKEYRVAAPQLRDGRLEFLPIGNEPVIDKFPTTNSVKDFFFPRCEVLYKFDKNQKQLQSVEPDGSGKKLLLFGARPCDTSAFGLFDSVFTKDYDDSTNSERMKAGLIDSLACIHPKETCFCTSVGLSPFGKDGCDVLAVELDDGFLLDPVSESGSAFINILKGREATKEESSKVNELEKKSISEMEKHFDLEKARQRIGSSFAQEMWDTFSSPCVSCSICTFVCPTCHCFDITDVRTRSGADRVKTWDSCMSPLFTLHASGHNPRAEKYRRWRQRVFHKFEYLPENVGILGCVGCGRCVIHCPVSMDIRRMIQIVTEAKPETAEVKSGE